MEQVAVGPNVRAVGRDKNGHVANDLDAARIGIGLDRLPLLVEKELQHALDGDLTGEPAGGPWAELDPHTGGRVLVLRTADAGRQAAALAERYGTVLLGSVPFERDIDDLLAGGGTAADSARGWPWRRVNPRAGGWPGGLDSREPLAATYGLQRSSVSPGPMTQTSPTVWLPPLR